MIAIFGTVIGIFATLISIIFCCIRCTCLTGKTFLSISNGIKSFVITGLKLTSHNINKIVLNGLFIGDNIFKKILISVDNYPYYVKFPLKLLIKIFIWITLIIVGFTKLWGYIFIILFFSITLVIFVYPSLLIEQYPDLSIEIIDLFIDFIRIFYNKISSIFNVILDVCFKPIIPLINVCIKYIIYTVQIVMKSIKDILGYSNNGRRLNEDTNVYREYKKLLSKIWLLLGRIIDIIADICLQIIEIFIKFLLSIIKLLIPIVLWLVKWMSCCISSPECCVLEMVQEVMNLVIYLINAPIRLIRAIKLFGKTLIPIPLIPEVFIGCKEDKLKGVDCKCSRRNKNMPYSKKKMCSAPVYDCKKHDGVYKEYRYEGSNTDVVGIGKTKEDACVHSIRSSTLDGHIKNIESIRSQHKCYKFCQHNDSSAGVQRNLIEKCIHNTSSIKGTCIPYDIIGPNNESYYKETDNSSHRKLMEEKFELINPIRPLYTSFLNIQFEDLPITEVDFNKKNEYTHQTSYSDAVNEIRKIETKVPKNLNGFICNKKNISSAEDIFMNNICIFDALTQYNRPKAIHNTHINSMNMDKWGIPDEENDSKPYRFVEQFKHIRDLIDNLEIPLSDAFEKHTEQFKASSDDWILHPERVVHYSSILNHNLVIEAIDKFMKNTSGNNTNVNIFHSTISKILDKKSDSNITRRKLIENSIDGTVGYRNIFSSIPTSDCEYRCPDSITCVNSKNKKTCPLPIDNSYSTHYKLMVHDMTIRMEDISLEQLSDDFSSCWNEYKNNPSIDPYSSSNIGVENENYVYCFPLIPENIPLFPEMTFDLKNYIFEQCGGISHEQQCMCNNFYEPHMTFDYDNYFIYVIPMYVKVRILNTFIAFQSITTRLITKDTWVDRSWTGLIDLLWKGAPDTIRFFFGDQGSNDQSFYLCIFIHLGSILWTILAIYICYAFFKAFYHPISTIVYDCLDFVRSIFSSLFHKNKHIIPTTIDDYDEKQHELQFSKIKNHKFS